MGRKRIVGTAIAAALAAAVSGLGTLAVAQTQPSGTPPGNGASGQARPGGDYGPGGVPRAHEATTQPSAPPSNAGSSTPTGSPGDHGPGGVPQKRETTTQPSGRSPADGGGAPDPGR